MIDKKEIAKKVKRELAWLAKAITIFYCIGLMLTTPMILAQEPNISESENLTIENLTADQDITITENNTSEGNQTENNETNISYLVVTKPNPIEINTSDENSTLEKTQSGFTGSDFVTQDETSAPDIEFVEPTPADQTITLNTSTETNITITETSLGKFIWNWNETNYTIYDDDLVLMMNFEKLTTIGENDTYIKDISKSNNDGTFYTNGTETHGYVTNGKQNGGWLFDGDGDYIDCGTGSSLNITDNVTVEVWVRATSVGGASDWRSIAGKGGGAWYIYQEQNAGPYNFELNTEITGWTWTYLGAVDPGNWHHLVATFDSGLDSNQIKTYRDGVLQSQSTSSGRIGDNSALNCYIGGGPAGYTRYFNGTIDEVRVYNRSLSAEEVKQHYYSNLQKYDADRWSFYTNQSNLSYGIYSYFAAAQDSTGNENATETRNIEIQAPDTTPPDLTFTEPTPINGESSRSNYTTINVTLSENVTNCILTWTYPTNQTINTPYVWVPGSLGNIVTKISTIDGTNYGNYIVGTNPYGIAVDAEGNVWTANHESNNVSKLNGTDGGTIGTYEVGSNPYGIAVDALGNVWVVEEGSNKVTKLNGTDGTIYGSYPVGSSPKGVAADANGNIWVASYNEGIVTKINGTDGSQIKNCTTGSHSFGVTVDSSGSVWVTGGYGVTKVNGEDASAIATYTTGNQPMDVGVDQEGNVWVSNFQSNTLTKLNGTDGTHYGNYTTPWYPYGVSADANGNIWVASYQENIVIKYNGTNGNQIANYTVGTMPFGLGDMTGFKLQYFVLKSHLTPNTTNYEMEIHNDDENTWANYTITELEPGSHNYTVTCTDINSNQNQTETRNLIVLESDAPTINLELPEDATTNLTSNSIDFTYNVSDYSDINNCSLIINHEINLTYTENIVKGMTQNLTTYLPNGDYMWSINCTDSSNNVGASETRAITVNYESTTSDIDFTAPTPANGETINIGYTTINITSSKNLSSCTLTWTYPTNQTINTPYVWVTNYNDGTVTKIGIDGTHYGNYTTGTNPYGAAVDTEGNVWVTNYGENTISKINGISGATIAKYSTGNAPFGLAVDSLGNIWVAINGEEIISKFNGTDGTQMVNYTTGSGPSQMAIDQLGNVWVTNNQDDTVTKLNGTDGTHYGNYTTGDYPSGVAVDAEGNIWVTNYMESTVSKLNGTDGQIIANYTTESVAMVLAIDAEGNVWTANSGGSTTKIKAIDGTHYGNYTTGTNPYGTAVDATGNVWIVSYGNGIVSKINGTDGQIITNYTVGSGPLGLGDMTGFTLQYFVLQTHLIPNTTDYNMEIHNDDENTWANYTVTELKTGNHSYMVSCADINSNQNQTETRILTVDITPPTINLEAPTTGITNLTTNDIDFTYNVTEEGTLANCSMIINNEINATDTNMLGNTAGQNFTTYIPDGTYTWQINCTDNQNNIGTSETRTITVDPTPPIINFVEPTPENGETIYDDYATINITVPENVTSCILTWGTETTISVSTPYVWLPNYFSHTVTKIGISDGTHYDNYTTGRYPYGVAIDMEGNVWVSNYYETYVSKINGTDGQIIANYTTGDYPYGNYPTGIAIDVQGNVWVTDAGGASVTKLNGTDGQIIANYTVSTDSGEPYAVAVDPLGNVWVINKYDYWVAKFNATDGTHYGNYTVGDSPRGIAADISGNIWVTSQSNNIVSKINGTDGQIIANYTVGSLPRGVVVDGLGNVWVTNNQDDTVTKLNGTDGTHYGNYTTGDGPWGVDADQEGNIWIVNYNEDTVSKLNGTDGQIIATYSVGDGPYGLGDMTGYILQHIVLGIPLTPGITLSNVYYEMEIHNDDENTWANYTITNLTEQTYNFSVSCTDMNSNQNQTEMRTMEIVGDSPPQVNFNFKDPADINTFNMFSKELNLSYTITDDNDIEKVTAYFKINNSVSDGLIYTNGTLVTGWQTVDEEYVTNESEVYYFENEDNEIYPGTYNIDEEGMEHTPHVGYVLSNTNTYIKTELMNVSNNKAYNQFEINLSFVSGTQALRIYACNSSYSTGSPTTNPNCNNFYSLPIDALPNHTHSEYSSHFVVPLAINTTTGMVGNVFVTETMQFLMRGQSSTTWHIGYINNDSRQGATQTTTNNGGLWTSQNWTIDAHIHSYTGSEYYRYYVCANDTVGQQNCSSEGSDLIELGGMPPTPPVITYPIEGEYLSDKVITITYIPAVSPDGYDIVEYNITLLNTDETYNQTITANNSINLNYGWNLTGVSLGEYVLMVVACDNQSLCSYGLSNNFTIVEDTTPPNIDFNSQSPPDIESTNLYSQNVVVSYNISDQNGVDTTGVIIYYKTNSTLSNIFFYINGTEYSDYQTEANITNESDKWLFTLTDNQVYPGSYNIDQEGMVYTPHEFYRLNGSYSYIKTRFYNITSTGQYNTFEIMANKSSNNSNSLRTFYCNESYTSGSPINSRNCNNFYNIPYNPADWPNTLYNHTQSEYSSYHVIPLAINTTSGTIGQVVITPVSYFLVRTGGGWDVAHVSNLTRESTTQVSTNWGYNWNNFEGTIDAHVQQYNPLDTFTYYVCANDTYGNQNCSEERYDLIQQAGLPPSAPEIYQPIEGYYTNTIEINYTSSMSPNGYEIINYNISLLNPDETFNQTIIGNNGLDLGYLWDTATITSGEYMISVESCDNMTQCSYGLSENFTIDRIPLFEQIESFSKDEDFAQFTINLQNNVSDVEDIDNMLTYNWTLNDTNVFNLEIDNSTGVATFTALANVSGSVLVDISVVDTVGLSNSTEFTVTVDAVNDVPWIDQLANVSVDEDNGISAAYTSAELNNSFRDVEENQNPASLTLLSQSDTSAISCSIEDGVICTTVANQSGSNTLLIEMNDSGNETVREMVTITVGAIDDVPWIDQLSNITVDEDNGTTTIYTSTEINNSFRDVEEDQNPSSLTLLSQSNITPINCSIENGIVCDTAANETGSNTLTIEMNDSSNSAVRELVTVTVNPVNDSPWFDQVANITMDEDNGTTTIYTSTEINNSFRDVEEDQTPITITIYQSNTTAISCSVGNGVVCTTAANESGYNDLIFEMGDSEGSKINQTITITVNPINDAPWVELDRPYDNATNTTMNDIDFTYIPYDVENSISNCSLIINKEINLTSTNIAIGSMNNLTSHLPNAEYNWSINCTDSDNSIVASETRNVNITFDTIPPAVNLEDPLYDTSWTSSSTINFKYNVSDSSEINNCSLILNYDDVNSTSTSITKDIVGQTFSATLANAAYNWSINCTDENNNIGSSDVWNITINYVAPTTTPTTGGGTGGGAGGGGGVITKEPTINVIHTKQTFLKIDKETNIGIIIENPNTLKNLINVRITATSSNDKIKVTLNKNYIEKILPGENKEIRLTLENAEKTTGKIYITVEVQDPVITYTSEINIMAMLEEEITSPEEKPVEEEMPTAITKERDWTAVKWVGLLLGVTLLLYLLRMVKFKGMKKQKPKVKKKPKKRNLPELPF